MKSLLKKRGISLTEALIATGLLSIVVGGYLNVSKISNRQELLFDQNSEVNRFLYEAATGMRTEAVCNSIVNGNLSTIDWDPLNFVFNTGVEITRNSASIVPGILTGGSDLEVGSVDILITFESTKPGGVKTTKKVTFQGEFNSSGNFLRCSNYEEAAIHSIVKIACEDLGANYSITSSGVEDCDFSTIQNSASFGHAVRREICTNLFRGTYTTGTGLCDRIDINNGVTSGANIEETRVRVNNNWRSTFNQNCTGPKSFIKEINIDGTVTCVTVTYCNPGLGC